MIKSIFNRIIMYMDVSASKKFIQKLVQKIVKLMTPVVHFRPDSHPL